MSRQDENGWIEWHGGECPISRTAMVEYRMRDLVEAKSIADDLDWRHFPKNNPFNNGDIIAYRVVKP